MLVRKVIDYGGLVGLENMVMKGRASKILGEI